MIAAIVAIAAIAMALLAFALVCLPFVPNDMWGTHPTLGWVVRFVMVAGGVMIALVLWVLMNCC